MAAIDFPASSASPFTAPDGTIYTWVTSGSSGYWSAAPTAADYLKLDASNDPVTGVCQFDGGIVLGGGDAADISSAGFRWVSGNQLRFVASSADTIAVTSEGRVSFGSPFANANTNIRNNLSLVSSSNTGFGYYASCEVDVGVTTYASQYQAVPKTDSAGTYAYIAGYGCGYDSSTLLGTIDNFAAFSAVSTPSSSVTDAGTKTAAFATDIDTGSNTNYGFYSSGTAASWCKGSLGIGVAETTFNPTAFILHTEGSVRLAGINSTGSTSPLYIASSGTLTTSSSDERLKTNIENLESSTEKVKQLNPISFNWIDTEEYGSRTHLGFTAQNVQAVVPEAVGTGAGDYLSLDTNQLIPVLTKALQEALTEIDALKARLDAAGV